MQVSVIKWGIHSSVTKGFGKCCRGAYQQSAGWRMHQCSARHVLDVTAAMRKINRNSLADGTVGR